MPEASHAQNSAPNNCTTHIAEVLHVLYELTHSKSHTDLKK